MIGACRECQTTKSKCSRDRPKCERCTQKQLLCTYTNKHRRKLSERSPAHSARGSLPNTSPDNRSDSMSMMGVEDTSSLMQGQIAGELEWLFAPNLPEDLNLLRRLAEAFFDRVHPLRSLGFIHKPTFMQSLDQGRLFEEYGEGLLNIMFALSSRYVLSNILKSYGVSPKIRHVPGEAWAARARTLAFESIGAPSIQNLMTFILLSEYGARAQENSTVFMITGCCARLAQLLRLDSELADETIANLPVDSQVTQKESRRRLMWACYILDGIVGSGVEHLLSCSITPPSLQLPCPGRDFIMQLPCATGLLKPDDSSKYVPAENLGIEAYTVRIFYLRFQVLR